MNVNEFLNLRYGNFYHLSLSTFNPSSGEVEDGTEDVNLVDFTNFDPGQWMDASVASGAKYICFTSKHLSGFAWWPSAVSPTYCISATDWYAENGNLDVLQRVCNEARVRGLKVFLYFSLKDKNYEIRSGVHHGDAYLTYTKAHLSEILGGHYGTIDGIWFDGPETDFANPDYVTFDRSQLYAHIKSLQPNCLVTFNWNFFTSSHQPDGGHFSGAGCDYGTNEVNGTNGFDTVGTVPAGELLAGENNKTPWSKWFWHSDIDYRTTPNGVENAAYLSLELLRESGQRGYNALINFPPDNTGQLPAYFLEALELIGRRAKLPARLGDDFRVNGLNSESVGVELTAHSSTYSGGVWAHRLDGGPDLIISPDKTARANGADAGWYVYSGSPTSADYGAEIRFGCRSEPSAGTIAVQLRTDATTLPRYSGYFSWISSGTGQVGVRDTDGVTQGATNFPFDYTKKYKLCVSIHGQDLWLRIWEYSDDDPRGYVLRTVKKTMGGALTAAGKAGIEYGAAPQSDSTGLYLIDFQLFYEDWTTTGESMGDDFEMDLSLSL